MTAENPYRDLTRDEMWQLLDDEPFGRLAVQAGRLARGAGRIPERRWAVPSSPMDGRMDGTAGQRARA